MSGNSRSTTTSSGKSLLYAIDKNSNYEFLIDSGASMSILPVRQIDKKNVNHELNLYAANGSVIKTYGERLLYVDFGFQELLPWIFTIADVSTPIIGSDFLDIHDISIHLRRKQLTHVPSGSTIISNLKQQPLEFPIISYVD